MSFGFRKTLSISHRLYAVLGVMTLLIGVELFTLRFAMTTLSAVRAFVNGEGIWSKSQKEAALSLQNFAIGLDEESYARFLEFLKVPEGDHRARVELMKPEPDLSVVRDGFLDGRIHPDDIPRMIDLIRRFSWIEPLKRAIQIWTDGDQHLAEFKDAGVRYHALLKTKPRNLAAIAACHETLNRLNSQLTTIENDFSNTLGEGSRWLEHIVITLLSLAVLTVEGFGLTLTFRTSRSISGGLKELSSTARLIGEGNFKKKARVESLDEIGQVAQSLNQMGEMLERSYQELETRVQERTQLLTEALRARDDFLSLASHELKTPLTSLKLQTQIRHALLEKDEPMPSREQLIKMMEDDDRRLNRITRLVNDMLDVSRLRTGKLSLQPEPIELCELAKRAAAGLSESMKAADCTLITDFHPPIAGNWDPFRLEQALVNLLTNAMKYARGKPVHLTVDREVDRNGESHARISVHDEGPGIAREDQDRIFGQFERVKLRDDPGGMGLGLFISRQIIESHGGTLSVESRPGEGSTFTILL